MSTLITGSYFPSAISWRYNNKQASLLPKVGFEVITDGPDGETRPVPPKNPPTPRIPWPKYPKTIPYYTGPCNPGFECYAFVLHAFPTENCITGPTSEWSSVCWSPDFQKFVAVSRFLRTCMTSFDGVTWTSHAAISGRWNSVCWSPILQMFCAVGTGDPSHIPLDHFCMTSTDGDFWVAQAMSSGTWKAVTWSTANNEFFAISSDGTSHVGNRFVTSENGMDWTTRSNPTTIMPGKLEWVDGLGKYIIIGNRTGTVTSSSLLVSNDGNTWTEPALPTPSGTWTDFAYHPGLHLLVVTGATNQGRDRWTLLSYNGLDYSQYSMPTGSWDDIEWCPNWGIFVALEYIGGALTSNRMATSPNGVDWTVCGPAGHSKYNDMVFSPYLGRLVAVGEITFIYRNYCQDVMVAT